MTILHETPRASGLDIHAVADRCEYVVIPRVIAQSMPDDWQRRLAALWYEMRAAYADLPHPGYRVETGEWLYVNEASPQQLVQAGVDVTNPYAGCEHHGPCEHDETPHIYTGPDGRELEDDLDQIFIASPDPLPHPNKGRAHVPPYDGRPYRTPPASLATFGRSIKDGTTVLTSGLVVHTDVKGPTGNPAWADLTISDGHGEVEVTVLPELFQKFRETIPSGLKLEGLAVIVEGRMYQRFPVHVIADSIRTEEPSGMTPTTR